MSKSKEMFISRFHLAFNVKYTFQFLVLKRVGGGCVDVTHTVIFVVLIRQAKKKALTWNDPIFRIFSYIFS